MADAVPPMISRRVLLAGFAFAGAGVVPIAAFAEESAGVVTGVVGEAIAQLSAKKRTLAPNAPVFVDDRIATGEASRAGMRLGRQTTLRLGAMARVKLDRFIVDAGGTITLGSGAALIEKEPGSGGSVRVRTPYGLIAVRGTRLFAGPSNGAFGVFVIDGSVSVTGAGKTVVVNGGEGTDIPRRGAPPTPVKRWGDARIQAALALVD